MKRNLASPATPIDEDVVHTERRGRIAKCTKKRIEMHNVDNIGLDADLHTLCLQIKSE